MKVTNNTNITLVIYDLYKTVTYTYYFITVLYNILYNILYVTFTNGKLQLMNNLS